MKRCKCGKVKISKKVASEALAFFAADRSFDGGEFGGGSGEEEYFGGNCVGDCPQNRR